MSSRSPGAFLLSLLIHGLFAGAMVFWAYALQDDVVKKTQIFELVAVEGDNYMATEAPALGTPEGVEFKMPNLPPAPSPAPAPAPQPEPVVQAVPPEPSPVEPAPPPPKPAPKPVVEKKAPPKPEPSPVTKAEPKKAEPAVPDLAKSMKRTQTRIANKQKAQREKEAKAAAAAAALAAKQAEINARKAELMKGGSSGLKTIDAKGIAKGVLGGSTNNTTGGAGGKALTSEEKSEIEGYVSLLKRKITDAHKKPEGVSDTLHAQAEFFVAPNGAIGRARIVQSSGNAEFDRSVLQAIGSITVIPPPRGWSNPVTLNFSMKDEE
ncbi:MAG: energy transducer TonB [Nibricoccus sp.]